MRIKYLVLIFAVLIIVQKKGKAQSTFNWAASWGSSSSDYGNSITVDAAGNVYTTGYFSGTVDFDPGPGTNYLTAKGDGTTTDIFISKLDASGNLIWVKATGGKYSDNPYSISLDGQGNIYTTGYFSDTVDFDPGPGVFNLPGFQNIFISKLDNAGNFVWAKDIGRFLDYVFLQADPVGTVYITGRFAFTHDFDPGPGTYELQDTSGRVFIAKYNSNGDLVWAKNYISFYAEVKSFYLDKSGHIYTAGWFEGRADFDPNATTDYHPSNGFDDIFLTKLDTSGNKLWAKQIGGVSSDYGSSVISDSFGNVYLSAQFRDTVDMDPGPGVSKLFSAGLNDVAIIKFDSTGNFKWARRIGGTQNDVSESVAVDAAGNVFTTGTFFGTADFNPGTGVYNLTTKGLNDLFLSKLDSAGNFISAINIGGTQANVVPYSMVIKNSDIIITGIFTSFIDFNPGPATNNRISFGDYDVFVLKLGQTAFPLQLLSFTALPKGSNIAELKWQTTNEVNTAKFIVERSTNNKDFRSVGLLAAAGNSAIDKFYQYTDEGGLNGINYYRLKMIDKDGDFSYSKVIEVKLGYLPYNIRLYPNPVQNVLHLETKDNNENTIYNISDVKGRVVKYGNLTMESGSISTINIQQLPAGNYTLTIDSKSRNQVAQFIKN